MYSLPGVNKLEKCKIAPSSTHVPRPTLSVHSLLVPHDFDLLSNAADTLCCVT